MAGEAGAAPAARESREAGPRRRGPGPRDAGRDGCVGEGRPGRRAPRGRERRERPGGVAMHPRGRRGASRLRGWVTPRLVASPPPPPGCHRPLTPRAGRGGWACLGRAGMKCVAARGWRGRPGCVLDQKPH